jgi:signal peptidase I
MAMGNAKTISKTREFIEGIIAAVLIALIITTFVIKMYKIPSRSMVPTLLVGDQLVVNKFIYGIKISRLLIRKEEISSFLFIRKTAPLSLSSA